MRSVQCLYNSRRALYQVFVSQAQPPRANAVLPRLLPPSTSGTHHSALQQRRWYAGTKPRRRPPPIPEDAEEGDGRGRGHDPRFTTQRDIIRSGRDRLPQDHEITDPEIMVIDGGSAEGPLRTRYVLTKLEAGESLRMIQPYVPANPRADPPTAAQFAVCTIVNKREEYARQKALKEKRRESAATRQRSKELELNWGIDEHDLATKMRHLGGFLARGMKVDIMLGRKRRGRPATAEAAEAVLRRVREEVEAAGGREVKPAEGEVGKTMKLYFERKMTKS